MTTLHVDLGREWRGGQNQVWLLLRGLRARGHSGVLLGRENSPLARRARDDGFRVHAVGGVGARFRAGLVLRRLLAQSPIDVVHAHDAHSLTAVWLAGAHRRSRLVAARRVVYPLHGSRLALVRYQRAHRIVAISRVVADSVIAAGLAPERVAIVYSGVELPPLPSAEARREARARFGLEADASVLGSVGALLPDKGQEPMIRALALLAGEFPRCQLLLAGEGPCRARLEALARELKVEPAVHFAGFVEDVAEVYAALDVFLFPALAEGLGSALLAAMAYELPVVTLDSGAGPEVIDAGRTGVLIPEREPATLAAAAAGLLRDAGRARQLGRAARAEVEERFTAERMVEGTLRIYEGLLAEGRRA